jgi:hypothetical protein
VAGSCECCDERLVSIKCMEFFDYLSFSGSTLLHAVSYLSYYYFIIRVNSKYFSMQHKLVSLCSSDGLCSL